MQTYSGALKLMLLLFLLVLKTVDKFVDMSMGRSHAVKMLNRILFHPISHQFGKKVFNFTPCKSAVN